MPVNTTAQISQDLNNINISKSNEKFADFSTITSFPKEVITSKMIQLTNHDESFLISCLTKVPLAISKNNRIIFPKYEKNDLIPFKPIQKLNSFAESAGALILSHGNHSLEFGRLAVSEVDGSFVISRFCQKATEKPYKKLLFEKKYLVYGKSDSQIDIYDFNRISKIGSISSKGNILDFDYCPTQPSVLAYTNGNLNITDTREPAADYKSLYKQTIPGGLIKWNPVVPYWISSASTNSLCFYDIRYNSSSPVISLNHSNIHSLCWSPLNSDLILAASSDRRINLWSMSRGEEECRLGMKLNRFEIGSLTSSESQNNVFYGLDDADSIVKIKIRSEYLALMAPHHDDSEYKDIQEALYSADYDNFKEKLTGLSKETFESGNFDKLKQLILLTTPSKPKTMSFDEKCLASIEIKKDLKEFKELLKQSTSLAFTLKESEEVQKFADQLRLKIRVVEHLAADDFESLKMFLNSITSAYCTDLDYLNKSQSIKLMALLLKHDRKSAFNFLTKIISSNPFGTPEMIQIWVWMACYPTIFDAKSFELIKIRPSLSKSVHDLDIEYEDDEEEGEGFYDDLKIEKCLDRMRSQFYDSLLLNQQIGPQNTKIILQLFLNLGTNPINFEQLIDTSDTILRQIHAALLEEQESYSIISAETIKLLLESALKSSAKNFLIEFFLIAFRLQVLTEKTLIYSGIQEFITSVGFSRLKFLINKYQDARAVNSIISIATDPYSTLSEEQLNYLSDQIKYIVEKIQDFSLLSGEFRIENDLKSSKFKSELQKLKNFIK